MTEKPILFNTEMVRAILDGRKTATRRVIKDPYSIEDEEVSRISGLAIHKGTAVTHGMPYPDAPYSAGDILYVRETWTTLYYVDPDGYTHYDQPMYYYAADGVPDITLVDADGFEQDDQRVRWRPSIHMPKKAARIWLRVTDVRIERLRDITDEGAVREGLYKGWRLHGMGSLAHTARQAFMWLWETITRKAPAWQSWACNPWVWVIEFERCEKPEEEHENQT